MKTYLAIFAVLFTVILSSCSNDDIPVTHATAFKVDPSTVISAYEEFNVGDLTSIWTNYQLRVRLLVYNDKGVLVESGESFSPDYTHIQTFNFNLAEGDYTTVAITDVVGKVSSAIKEFYTLSDQERLNTTTLTYTGYVAGSRGILGLTTEKQRITSAPRDVNIKVRSAGALIVCYLDDWNACLNFHDNGVPLDVEKYLLLGNKASSSVNLNSFGEPEYSINSNTDCDYIWFALERDSQYRGGYGYCFKFPMTNVKLEWVADTSSGRYAWGDQALIDIEAGKEYYFELEVANDAAGWYDVGISTKAPSKIQNSNRGNVVKTEIDFPIENEPVSVKAISYLKKK